MAKEKSVKEFEKWADAELKKFQKILLTGDRAIEPIKPSKCDTSYSYVRFPYKEIKITYGDSLFTEWKKGNKAYASKILLHESIHTLIDPLMHYAMERCVTKETLTDQMEQLTDHFTNVVDLLLKK